MKVLVQVYLDTSDVQHEKLALKLVEPIIEGFSVPRTKISDEGGDGKKKRDADDVSRTPSKKLKK